MALADQILQAELAIRDPATPPEVLDAAGRLQQVAYRRLGENPAWEPEVLARTPVELHETIWRQATARREFRAMHTRLGQNLPAWRIVDPLPADELLALYQEAEARFGVPWDVLAAVNLVETGMGRIVGLSSAGAQGPMQFMPPTWEAYGMGGDVWNTRDAIMGAANYLAANGGGPRHADGLANALFHYNRIEPLRARASCYYAEIMRAEPRTFLGAARRGRSSTPPRTATSSCRPATSSPSRSPSWTGSPPRTAESLSVARPYTVQSMWAAGSECVDDEIDLRQPPRNYRAYIGCEGRYDLYASLQFDLLTLGGLRDHHRVCDVGCGSLRLGRLLIPYLEPGHYFGVEPEEWLIREGIAQELGEEIVAARRPTFSSDSEFDLVTFGVEFDYVIAHSVFSHAGQAQIRRAFEGARRTMAHDGVFYATFLLGDHDHDGGWTYPDLVPYRPRWIRSAADGAGLHAQFVDWPHPGRQHWVALTAPTPRRRFVGRRTRSDRCCWLPRGCDCCEHPGSDKPSHDAGEASGRGPASNRRAGRNRARRPSLTGDMSDHGLGPSHPFAVIEATSEERDAGSLGPERQAAALASLANEAPPSSSERSTSTAVTGSTTR